MIGPRVQRAIVLAATLSANCWLHPALLAQGITTGSIGGTVRTEDGRSVDEAQVRVLNTTTGVAIESTVRRGRFLVQGLEVGGPYVVTIRQVGFILVASEPVRLGLGESLELDLLIRPIASRLDTVQIMATPAGPRVSANGGIATTIFDSLVHRLPTLNRDLYDFVRLVPQISMKVGRASAPGISAGGVGDRFNSFLINGVSERSIGANVPPAFRGARSLPLDAVSEYEVLVAPFDVRYGDFAGALVNTVTRSGTNQLHGSVFAYGRSDALARHNDSDTTRSPYEQLQYGLSLGGPIRQDRAHFFIASEVQRLTSPASGPYIGEPASVTAPVPVREVDLERLGSIMRGYGLVAGSGGAVQNGNPETNVFGRFDVNMPAWQSRVALSVNDVEASQRSFSRATRGTFPLGTFQTTQSSVERTTSVQLRTSFHGGGGYNELVVSHRRGTASTMSDVEQPIVNVAVPGATGGAVAIVTGTPEAAQVGTVHQTEVDVQEHLSLAMGRSQVAIAGLQAERFRSTRGGVPNAYGTWTFSSLDSLERGVAQRYEAREDFGTGSVPITGWQYAAYVGDEWRPVERLSVALGLRSDLLAVDGRPSYNPRVDSVFGRRTDAMPAPSVHLSPRVGFTWDLLGDGRDQLRGGLGIFTGRPPLSWIQAALYSYGVGVGVLRCGTQPADLGLPPAFAPDPRTPPRACANGSGITTAPRGDVDLLDHRLGMAETVRGVLAYDRRLPWDVLGTAEAVVTRNMSDFVFVNLNLAEPRGADRHGRVLYGTIATTGAAAPSLRSDFSEVIDLRNTSRNHSFQLSMHLEKRFSDGVAATAAYTYSRARDVETPLRVNMTGLSNWSSARVLSGRDDDLTATTSLDDIPHRVVVAATYRAPWRRWPTDGSFSYVGEAGSPFAYRAWGVGLLGDLNADGSNVNDPIYVPRSAFDTSEIRFAQFVGRSGTTTRTVTVAEQQAAFEQFIARMPCLRRQRGRILERNSCREPWSHTTIASARQGFPAWNNALETELEIFNVLNLLRHDWGQYRVASLDRSAAPPLLEQVGQTPGPLAESQPIFQFDPRTTPWATLPTESVFQLQVSLRYRF
jgi:hypothetical protein